MKNLFLTENIQQLRKNRRINQTDCTVINLDNFATLEEGFDKAFLEKRYLDLIASLGKEMESIYWWASALPEKNSFRSKLFGRVHKLACLDKAIKKIYDKNIVVICSDPVLIEQIRLDYKKDFTMHLPSFLRIYSRLKTLRKLIIGILAQLHMAICEYQKLLYARVALHSKKRLIEKGRDYVVLRTGADHRNYKSGEYRDSYFKELPNFFLTRGRNVLIYAKIASRYIDIRKYKNMIDRFKDDVNNLIVPVNFYLKGIDILRALFITYFRRPGMKKHVVCDDIDITHLVNDELLWDISTVSFFDAVIQYYSCIRLAESVSIERFIYTFENYAREKMSILGLRKQDTKIKIIGFQHAFISKNSFKYFPGSGEDSILPLPDKIVTMGKRTQEIMKRLGSYPDGIFSTGCALRQEYLFQMTVLPRNISGSIFVALTITDEDTIKVLRFLSESDLGKRPDKVYLRFHPAMPVKSVVGNLDFRLPDNFIISDNPSVRKEMERCSVVLYTWTTICLEALKMGRPAIYLDVNYPLEVDPLFECNYLKDICRNPAELAGKIERLRNMNNDIFSVEFKKAQDYLDEYFMPVNERTLDMFSV